MGSDDFFKKKRNEKKLNKTSSKEPKNNSFLIVTEGKKTEPLYFGGIKDLIVKKYGGYFDVETPDIKIEGAGKNTISLVEETQKIVNRAHIIYSQVWVVFDKDDFERFDEAIQLAEKNDFNVAWSNQCFEYWLYLHFVFSDSALHRHEWFSKLDKLFVQQGIKDGYEKNLDNIFELVSVYGSLKQAIQNAKRIEEKYSKYKDMLPSKKDPCTTVHKLLLELKAYLTDVV